MSNWMNETSKKTGCHTGNPVVFEAMGVKVHAGGHSRNGGYHRMSPAPDLAMGPAQVMGKQSATVVPDGFTCAEHVSTPYIISIDWPDFDIPQDIHREWWLSLVDDMRRLGIKSVSTQCVGGHGRTGVQLAILAHIMGAVQKPDAASLIKWVRSTYCSHAVETASQQQYVAECCDIPMGDSLFASFKARGPSLTFSDDAPVSVPKSIYWADEDEDYEDGLSIPKGFNLLGCHDCGDLSWVHEDDADKPCKCGSPERLNTNDILYDTNATCLECDSPCNDLAIQSDGRCLSCHAQEQKKKTRDGDVQCGKCKRYYIPEVINCKTFHCVGCERKATQKPKGKGKKGLKPVPKGGLKGKDLYDFVDGFKEDNC
jgi:hypothetical protein